MPLPVAAPVAIGMEVYDAYKFLKGGDSREEMMKEAEEDSKKNFVARAALGALSPTKTLLTSGANIKDAISSSRAAREAEANLKTAENRQMAMEEARRQDYSDSEWLALPREAKRSYMIQLRKKLK